MQEQLTIRLPEDLARALRAAARQTERHSSEIVRMALRDYLGVRTATKGRPADRVRGLIGTLQSGISDLAERHRAYVLESLKNAR